MEPTNRHFAEFESRRLSFVSWPFEQLVSAVALAANGYYHLGYGAAIRCYYCGVLLNDAYCAVNAYRYHTNQCVFSDTEHRLGSSSSSSSPSEQMFAGGATWRQLFTQSMGSRSRSPISDQPPRTHHQHSHSYQHDHGGLDQRHRHSSTVPDQPPDYEADTERETATTTVHVARLYIGPSGEISALNLMPVIDQNPTDASAASMAEVADGYRARGPWYWMYAKYDQRLKTFKTWPPAIPIKKQQMADAGFFYTDHNDSVTCYYCACQLRAWEPTDDPWIEHAKVRLRPNDSCYVVDRSAESDTVPDYCHYVNMNKGLEFIRRARAGTDATGPEAQQSSAGTSDSCTANTTISSSSDARLDDSSTATVVAGSDHSSDAGPSDPSTAGLGNSSDSGAAGESTDQPCAVLQNCLICCTETPNVLFYPCGHLVSCYRCAAGHTRCFVCREKIIEVIKVFLP